MSDHCEEQEMEAEALAAIFDTAFETISDTQPFQWSVKLVPVDCGGDEEEENRENHVAVKLLCTIPMDYPESLPTLDLEILKVRGYYIMHIRNAQVKELYYCCGSYYSNSMYVILFDTTQ